MHSPLERLNARARAVRRLALLASLPPLACHLAAPALGPDAPAIVAAAEVALAVGLRMAGVPFDALRPRPLPRGAARPAPDPASAPLAVPAW